MKAITIIISFLLFVSFSCTLVTKKNIIPFTAEENIVTQSTPDNVAMPRSIPAGAPVVIPAGKPAVVTINNHEVTAGEPKITRAGQPKIVKPGEDGLPLPEIVKANAVPIIAGIPEVVTGTPSTKDLNPKSFSFFGIMQGLKTNGILCMLEDKTGNLWIGTSGKGISRYDGKRFTHYTETEGLGQNFVTAILEDDTGAIWFGFLGRGIGKYDGKKFTNYTIENGLSDNWISCMTKDSKGNLWIGTVRGGVNKYDGKDFIHYRKEQGLINDTINTIVEDHAGNIWIGGQGGLLKYDGESFSQYSHEQGLNTTFITSMVEDNNHDLWLGTVDGLVRFDGENFAVFKKEEGLYNNNVVDVEMDERNNLWLANGGSGITYFDRKTFRHFTEEDGLANFPVWNIMVDKSGNIWIATVGGGLNRYNGNEFSHFNQKQGLLSSSLSEVLEDKKGSIWVGTWAGVSRYDSTSFTNFTPEQGLINELVWCMAEDSKDNLWFGTLGGVSKFDGKTFSNYTVKQGLNNDDVKCIIEDKKGNLWFGATDGVTKFDGKKFTHFTEKEGLGKHMLMCLSILEDSRGSMWFGTGGGLSKYDGKNFSNFSFTQGKTTSAVACVVEDKAGDMWIGTLGNGLFKYDGTKFRHYGEREGLSNNSVSAIVEDDDNNLWCATDNGISMLDKERKKIKTYTYEDGFLGYSASGSKSILQSRNGTFWISANDRLTIFHPNAYSSNIKPPVVQLTGVNLFNENVSWQYLKSDFMLANGVKVHDFRFDSLSKWYGVPVNLTLPYDNNHIGFQYVGVTLKTPGKVKYQYMLEGLDKNWNSPTDRTDASYGSLPHGKYIFKVKAMNQDGRWSEELHYSITIKPPWWRTWWAYTLFVILFLGVVYALFRYRINSIRTKHELAVQQHKLTELEMQALRAQMNPHFIFNSLNSINLFILQNNRLQASEYLSKFSRLVGMILHHSQESFIPLKMELDALGLYLELESLRFEKQFTFNIDVEETINPEHVKVPPLIIQPYAENAIWHGLMNKGEHGHLEITIYQQENLLCVKVKDNGIGRKKALEYKSKFSTNRKSVGMRITSDRIAMLHDNTPRDTFITVTDVSLTDGSSGGTEVFIKIPLSV